jgi:hypothetical protein
MERGNIEIKLANGKSLSTNSGEEIFHFHRSEGKSIVPDQPKQPKREPAPKVV